MYVLLFTVIAVYSLAFLVGYLTQRRNLREIKNKIKLLKNYTEEEK